MRAISFDVSIPRYVVARTLGRVTDSAVFGALSGVRLGERELPALPGPEWVRLDVVACGICGTDLATLAFTTSPAMEPFASFPAVPGHEIVARVARVGPGVTRFRPGDRVSVDPMISCDVRGYPEGDRCPSCRKGLPGTCERAGEEGPTEVDGEPFAPGVTLGYHRQLPGGWSESILAHGSQLHPVPGSLDDRTAVLVEPLSIGVHAVLGSFPGSSDRVLVVGSGPIALGTVWALRSLGFDGHLVVQAKRPHEREMARRLGAGAVVAPGLEARQALVETGAWAYQPILGPEVYAAGGFDVVFDCVGSRDSIDQALRFASPRGRVVLLGCAGSVSGLDLTFVWARELDVVGSVGYGAEEWQGGRLHTFEITTRLLAEGRYPAGELVTDVHPLEEYREALASARDHARSGAIKVVLRP